MRKLKFLAVAAIAVAAVGTGAYVSVERSNDAVASDVALANVEALAWGEESDSYYRLFPCPSSYSENECRFSQDKNRPACSVPTDCF